MSILKALPFFLVLVGDGTSTVISMDMTKSPIGVGGGSANNTILNDFIHVGLPVPLAVQNLSSVFAVSGSISGNNLTLTFVPAPTAGQAFVVQGDFTF